MKQLYLLRHAKSDWADPGMEDFDRPLNRRGRKSAERMAAYLRAQTIEPGAILCSPARRTRQTLSLLEPVPGAIPPVFDRRIYEARPGTLLTCLRDLPDGAPSVLLIGHNPGIEQLVHLLAGANGENQALERLAAKFPTCALAVLTAPVGHWHDLGPGICRLDSFVRPADLEPPSPRGQGA